MDPTPTPTAHRPPGPLRVVPNVLSSLRIAAALALPVLPVGGRLPVVLFAGASDMVDGALARRLGVTSILGGYLDGIADKLFMLAAMVTFLGTGEVTPLQALLVLARDLTVAALMLYGLARRDWEGFRRVEARWAGKLTTLLAFPWLVTLLVGALAPLRWPLFVATAAASVAAALDYVARLRQVLAERRREASGGPRPDPRARL